MPRRLIVEIGSENWFAAGCPIRQRELFRCRQPFRQRELVRCRQPVRQRELFRCRQPVRQRELVHCRLPNSVAKTVSLQAASSTVNRKFAAEHATRQRIVNALQTTQFQQRITIRCTTHNSAANVNSPQLTQFRQRITVSLHNTQLGSEC